MMYEIEAIYDAWSKDWVTISFHHIIYLLSISAIRVHEEGNKPFKDSLQDWMMENKTSSWSIGWYIVRCQLNLRPNEAQGNQVLYEAYYSFLGVSEVEAILGENANHIRWKGSWNYRAGWCTSAPAFPFFLTHPRNLVDQYKGCFPADYHRHQQEALSISRNVQCNDWLIREAVVFFAHFA